VFKIYCQDEKKPLKHEHWALSTPSAMQQRRSCRASPLANTDTEFCKNDATKCSIAAVRSKRKLTRRKRTIFPSDQGLYGAE